MQARAHTQVFFCGMRQNAILEVRSQKDPNWNSIPEPLFSGVGITNTPLSNRILCHYAFQNFFFLEK
jgi:hypothetical protein